jgi:hypothetical protein
VPSATYRGAQRARRRSTTGAFAPPCPCCRINGNGKARTTMSLYRRRHVFAAAFAFLFVAAIILGAF